MPVMLTFRLFFEVPTDLIKIKMIKRKEIITSNEIPFRRDVFQNPTSALISQLARDLRCQKGQHGLFCCSAADKMRFSCSRSRFY